MQNDVDMLFETRVCILILPCGNGSGLYLQEHTKIENHTGLTFFFFLLNGHCTIVFMQNYFLQMVIYDFRQKPDIFSGPLSVFTDCKKQFSKLDRPAVPGQG